MLTTEVFTTSSTIKEGIKKIEGENNTHQFDVYYTKPELSDGSILKDLVIPIKTSRNGEGIFGVRIDWLHQSKLRDLDIPYSGDFASCFIIRNKFNPDITLMIQEISDGLSLPEYTNEIWMKFISENDAEYQMLCNKLGIKEKRILPPDIIYSLISQHFADGFIENYGILLSDLLSKENYNDQEIFRFYHDLKSQYIRGFLSPLIALPNPDKDWNWGYICNAHYGINITTFNTYRMNQPIVRLSNFVSTADIYARFEEIHKSKFYETLNWLEPGDGVGITLAENKFQSSFTNNNHGVDKLLVGVEKADVHKTKMNQSTYSRFDGIFPILGDAYDTENTYTVQVSTQTYKLSKVLTLSHLMTTDGLFNLSSNDYLHREDDDMNLLGNQLGSLLSHSLTKKRLNNDPLDDHALIKSTLFREHFRKNGIHKKGKNRLFKVWMQDELPLSN